MATELEIKFMNDELYKIARYLRDANKGLEEATSDFIAGKLSDDEARRKVEHYIDWIAELECSRTILRKDVAKVSAFELLQIRKERKELTEELDKLSSALKKGGIKAKSFTNKAASLRPRSTFSINENSIFFKL